MDMQKLFGESQEVLSSFQRIPLLKKIEEVTAVIFEKEVIMAFPEETRRQMRMCAHSNFEGIEEFSDQFYECYSIASRRQELTRSFIKSAMEQLNHGFDAFDTKLISHSTQISSLYDKFYVSWTKAVRDSDVCRKLEENRPVPGSHFYNHYTIIQVDGEGNLSDVPYALFFKDSMPPILKAFDVMISDLQSGKTQNSEQEKVVEFLKQYRKCLGGEDKDSLEKEWMELDRVWMDVKYYIQIVHDIEYGYGDPLRIKAIPDFSLRFVDETFAEANETIASIQKDMVEYFEQRDADLARKGLFALHSSFAAIYYIPFQCGMSLHFRFSGQSIPNRSEVKNEKGVKIYFDPVSTAAREVQTAALVEKAFHDSNSLCLRLDTIETLVWHVAAHEIGHAIYGLDHMKDLISSETKSLLEEPRAELTTLRTMKLLHDKGRVSLQQLQKYLSSFALQDLRRYAMFDNVSTRPYTISAIHTYKIYNKHGYIVQSSGKLSINDEKAYDVLQDLSKLFEDILHAQDRLDGTFIENVLNDMQEEEEINKFLVRLLFSQ